MKAIAYYLIAIYSGVSFLSIYSCFADVIVDHCLLTMQVQHLLSYLVYFILYKTWLLGLILPIYFLLFYKYYGMEKIFYKITFIVVLSVCLTSIFQTRDLCFGEPPKGIRLFAVYFLTGLSLLYVHLKYWHKSIDNAGSKPTSVEIR